ncbi:MAG: hypothetical protein IKC46_09095 [Lachnospiraceae bacterium]|nr:hypothetical protein [Lachnospiraceae bacterium]
MENRKKDLILVITMAVFLGIFALWCMVKTPETYSESERRVLPGRPDWSAERFWNGKFISDFEDYAADQFPMRDLFRSIKAAAEQFVFGKLDNNDLYLHDGYAAKMEYPLQEKMLDHAADRFLYLYDTYLADTDTKLYFSVIPDKGCYLAKEAGRLSVDLQELIGKMREKTDYMQYVDISGVLSLQDYYRTDTHWKQENLEKAAELLADAMGVKLQASYEKKLANEQFFGVYKGQTALPLKPDQLYYLTNDMLESCIVTSYDTGKPKQKQMYDLQTAQGRDPYEMFLGGSDALLVVENPAATSKKELVVFRDSFAGSLVPLLVEGYSKVTLVDIRYVSSSMLGNFIEFKDQDVLFLYSTLLLNNSLALK